jgi:hypothetical protein
MRVLIIIAFSAFGLILGFGLGHWSASGYLQSWEELPVPPNQIVDLLPAGDHLFNIKTLDGGVYRFSDRNNEGWIEETPHQDSSTSIEIQEPCDFSSSEFSFLSSPPRNIDDCIQVDAMYIDGYIRYAFVLDGNGHVWQWQLTRSPYKALGEQVCFPSLGLFIGVCIGIPVAILSRRGNGTRNPIKAVSQ